MISTRIRACVLAGAFLAGACSGDDDTSSVTVPDETTSTSTTATSTTSTTADPTAAVEQAFYDQWDAFVEIRSDPSPPTPWIDEILLVPPGRRLLDSISV